MSRWRFFDRQDGENLVALDLESLRFFGVGAKAAEILSLADEGMDCRGISAKLEILPSQVSSVIQRAQCCRGFQDESDGTPHALAKLSLHVAHLCNLQCTYCYAQGGDYGQGPSMMSQSVARSAVDSMAERYGRIDTVQFFGGEPLLNWPTILSVCEYLGSSACALSPKPHTGIVTNLTYYRLVLQ